MPAASLILAFAIDAEFFLIKTEARHSHKGSGPALRPFQLRVLFHQLLQAMPQE